MSVRVESVARPHDGKLNAAPARQGPSENSHRYLQAALFGDAAYSVEPGAVPPLSADGLSTDPAWSTIAACYLTHSLVERGMGQPSRAGPAPGQRTQDAASPSAPDAS